MIRRAFGIVRGVGLLTCALVWWAPSVRAEGEPEPAQPEIAQLSEPPLEQAEQAAASSIPAFQESASTGR